MSKNSITSVLNNTEYRDENFIGVIQLNNTINEDAITSKKNKLENMDLNGEIRVYTYGSEGDKPHFHLFTKDKNFETCIGIYEPKYFLHNGYKDKLTNDQAKILNKWLGEINKSNPFGLTNWQTIVVTWESANPDCNYPITKKCVSQPNYEYLNR